MKIISLNQTIIAGIAVQRELYKIGLWYENSKLIQTEIYWTSIPISKYPGTDGIFTHGVSFLDRMLGYKEGHIYIPKWVLSQGFWQNRASLKDIIRHEYGHALAHHYPELIVESTKFEKTFGGNYNDSISSSMEPDSFISKYAETNPCEDFAETFMVFVRKQGALPFKINNKKLIQKWNFIHFVCNRISQL